MFVSTNDYPLELNESYTIQIEKIKKAVGKTPLSKVLDSYGSKIYAKLEYFNPFSYSVKDRTAAYMLTGPLERGEVVLSNDTIWVEASSGNLGIAYGKIGRLLGLRIKIVAPSIVGNTTLKRIERSTESYEMVPDGYCPRGERDGAIKKVMDMWTEEPERYIWRDQYSNMDNLRAHKETTGPEIWKQTEGKIDTLVVACGTGGTIVGTGLYLKEQNPDIEIIGVQPQLNHNIHGVRNYQESLKPLLIEDYQQLIDEWIIIDDKKTFEAVKFLWKKGYPVGSSSGLSYAASRTIAKKKKGKMIVTLFPDILMNSFKTIQEYIASQEKSVPEINRY